jgi:hypothetical protein
VTGGQIPPYWVGVGISLACYLGLFWVVDQLVARRAYYPGTRLVSGSFVALYETLLTCSASPLTEPVYLLALSAAVLVLDRESPSRIAAFIAGVILGAAFTVRLEAIAPTAGLGLYVAARCYQTGGWRLSMASLGAFATGWLITAGWLVGDVDYLRRCSIAQSESYTFPQAHGLKAHVVRMVECVYHAVTVWLPFALVLPYWVLVGAGLTHRAAASGRPVLHPLLLAVVIPGLVAVGLTIMHKRTASFLFPAAAIWVALGAEMFARCWAKTRFSVAIVLGLVVAANLIQAARIGFSIRTLATFREEPDFVAATILGDVGTEEGRVWAFGSEPDIYALRRWPIVYPFFDRDKDYNRAYASNAGNPAAFIAELKRREFRYLVFVLAPSPKSPTERSETQPFSCYGPLPERADLEQIAAEPERFGLKPLGTRPALAGRTGVHVYRLH